MMNLLKKVLCLCLCAPMLFGCAMAEVEISIIDEEILTE